MIQRLSYCTAVLLLLVGAVRAEPIGQVTRLPDHSGAHWIWVSDLILKRTALIDADTGEFLGMLSGGLGTIGPSFAPDGREIYLPETYYSRGTRGERTDLVTIYDAQTLSPLDEIGIPPKRAEHASGVATSALSDDGRFLAVFNLTPASSLTIVDVKDRSFRSEIATPGCALVYAAGDRQFAMLCGDGTLLTVTIDDDGKEVRKRRSEHFFDPAVDPLTEKASRVGDIWLFVSFDGWLHPVDFTGDAPRIGEKWSLVTEADREASWRIGGAQHLAVHEGSHRLYALMHQGGADTHKQAGTEVWVYDLATNERMQRIPTRNPVGAFLLQTLEAREGGLADWLLQALLPNPGVDRIQVTRDDAPVLVTLTAFPVLVSIHDALTGEHLRDVREAGIGGSLVEVP